MKKIFLVLSVAFLMCSCGIKSENAVDNFVKKVKDCKSYESSGVMEIYSNEDTYTYNFNVKYMKDNYFNVKLVNKVNSYEQIIVKDLKNVYVITPSLNKSYKFESEWPYNGSQAYLLNTLVNDINNTRDIVTEKNNDDIAVKVNVNYPNNKSLKYQKLFWDKKNNLKKVLIYDDNDVVSIKVEFDNIKYNEKISKDEFDVEKIVSNNCCDVKKDDKMTGGLQDIVYPMYVPSNTYLNSKEVIDTDNGERTILTFNGDKNFVLIEESSNISDEFETIPVFGEPLMVSDIYGALSTNSLSWTVSNVDYYLVSNDLSGDEMLTIANSLGQSSYVEK